MDSLQQELTHLVALMAAPFRESWKQYAWAKANILAQHDPFTYAELPRLLQAAMKSTSTSTPESGTQEVKA